MKEEIEIILKHLDTLEEFLNRHYIDLKTYYEIKDKILMEYIAIGEVYKSENSERILNLWRMNKLLNYGI